MAIEYEQLGKLNAPFFEAYRDQFKQVLESGWYVLGKQVSDFEQQFAAYNGTKHCIGVASGLDAITLSLAAFDFEAGDEVIVPSNTYIATILSIVQNNLKPVLVEPEISTYNIDPSLIEERITPRTKAIVVVHLYGKCCNMEPIVQMCEKHGLKLIEDCAQAHGAHYNGQKAGTFGDFGAFSFYPTKNLGALGDGGAVICDDEAQMKRIRRLRNYGSDVKYHNEVVGYNSRLDEMQAAFLSVKLAQLDRINAHKRDLAQLYLEGLKDDYILPVVDDAYFDVYHIFNIRHERRDQLRQFLLDREIKTEIHYPVPPHQQKALKGRLKDQSHPISELIHQTTLSLPISFYHTANDVSRVIEAMNQF